MSELAEGKEAFLRDMERLGEITTAIHILDRYIAREHKFSDAAQLLSDGDLVAECGMRRLQLTALEGKVKASIARVLQEHPDMGLWVLKELRSLDDGD